MYAENSTSRPKDASFQHLLVDVACGSYDLVAVLVLVMNALHPNTLSVHSVIT